MVFLISQSNINQSQYPLAFEWDSLVRKHYNQYQKLIDAQTYQIQRLQRYLFVSAHLLCVETVLPQAL